MNTRERWIVYPLLFLAVGSSFWMRQTMAQFEKDLTKAVSKDGLVLRLPSEKTAQLAHPEKLKLEANQFRCNQLDVGTMTARQVIILDAKRLPVARVAGEKLGGTLWYRQGVQVHREPLLPLIRPIPLRLPESGQAHPDSAPGPSESRDTSEADPLRKDRFPAAK